MLYATGDGMRWEDLPAVVDDWRAKLASPAAAVRAATGALLTARPVGHYLDAASARSGYFAPLADSPDAARVKTAVARATGSPPLSLSYQDLADPAGTWVKVGYSQGLRRAGELLNFFPGQYPGGVPNAPSPLAAMLTSGLLGAGLGWGAGRLAGAVLPAGYGKKLGRTGAILGGLAGAAPGLAWGLTNRLSGNDFNDPSLLDGEAGAEPDNYPGAAHGANAPHLPPAGEGAPEGLRHLAEMAHESNLHRFKLGADYLAAVEKVASAFGTPDRRLPHPADVNIDALGRTLWDSGASPALAATTMAGVYAAHQLPDPAARPGWVTGNQLGQLAMNTAGDYATGYLVGSVLNAVAGTPHRASTFGAGAAVLGVLGAVVPKLFGR